MKTCAGKIALHDDGCAFMCMKCGTITQRTRDNPYPTIKHRPCKPEASVLQTRTHPSQRPRGTTKGSAELRKLHP